MIYVAKQTVQTPAPESELRLRMFQLVPISDDKDTADVLGDAPLVFVVTTRLSHERIEFGDFYGTELTMQVGLAYSSQIESEPDKWSVTGDALKGTALGLQTYVRDPSDGSIKGGSEYTTQDAACTSMSINGHVDYKSDNITLILAPAAQPFSVQDLYALIGAAISQEADPVVADFRQSLNENPKWLEAITAFVTTMDAVFPT